MNGTFNVMDMAKDMAKANDVQVSDLFLGAKEETTGNSFISNNQHSRPAEIKNPANTNADTGWVPDASLTSDLPEFAEPVTYAQDEIKVESDDKTLRNLSDDDAVESSSVQKDEMVRMNENIEAAKARFGISKLQVPPGKHQVAFYTAASDTNTERAAEKLDVLFRDMIESYPEFIMEWDPDSKYRPAMSNESDQAENVSADQYTYTPAGDSNNVEERVPNEDEVKVIIDKNQLPDVSWTDDDIDKIRKARTVELNIVEGKPIEFSEIKKVTGRNVVDDVISKYVRKKGDVTASLPASRYRCTFTGLSYPEVMDLSNAPEINTMDREIKRWTICFNHMRNMSIGEWDEYKWYIDPFTNKSVRVAPGAPIPDNVDPNEVHHHTKFQDFLEKTSFMDLNFMMWKILCATCMDTEIIQIDCHATTDKGTQCNNHYDWIYSPQELLEMNSISEAVLEEMKRTAEVSGSEEIMNNYRESFLVKDRTVKLTDSGIYVVFGHISAKKYLDDICPVLKALEREAQEAAAENRPVDPSLATTGLNYTTLTIVKSFIVVTDQGTVEISDTADMIEIVENLGEVDWQSIGRLAEISMSPYDFRYSIRGLVCPRCKNRSRINIENVAELLFIAARSLSSVRVEFKTT